MTSIWEETSAGQWIGLQPSRISLEAHLEEMVFRSVGMLPLSGAPDVVALARQIEVPETRGRVDIFGVERNGTPVLIEVKLRQNQEARRAVVAQVLSYAASLRGSNIDSVLRSLKTAGFDESSILDAIGGDAPVDEMEFNRALETNLTEGRFRLVLVLDDAPSELVSLVGYLESISGGLLSIDLITVYTYELSGRRIAVPQRVDPQHYTPSKKQGGSGPTLAVELGADLFTAAVDQAPPESREALTEMAAWAKQLEREGLASLITRQGTARTVLTLRVMGEDRGLVSLWNQSGIPNMWIHGTVIDRRAPQTALRLRSVLQEGSGSKFALKWADVTPELLDVIVDAYSEASKHA